MDDPDDGSDDEDVPEFAFISEARRLAASAVMLLEHSRMDEIKGTGLYVTAYDQAKLIMHCVQVSEDGCNAEEFDVLRHLICRGAENLAETLSLLRIP